jgi:hypothetical protein
MESTTRSRRGQGVRQGWGEQLPEGPAGDGDGQDRGAAQCQQLFVGGVTYPVHNWPQSCTIVAAAPPPEACWEGWGSPLGWWARRWGGRERAEEHVARTKIYDR